MSLVMESFSMLSNLTMEMYSIWSFLAAAVITGIPLYLWWLLRNDDYWKIRGIPYAPRDSFIQGFLLFLSKPLHEIFLERYRKYGKLFGGFEMRKPNLTVGEPDLIRDILVKDFHVFSFRREIKTGEPMIDKMLSVLNGEDWKRIRTIVSPAFTSRRMRQMSHIINECSKALVAALEKHQDPIEPADVKRLFGTFTMDVIASAAFATKIDSLNDPENVFVKHVRNTFAQVPWWRLLIYLCLPTKITMYFRLGALDSMDFFKNVILQVIKERKKTDKKYDDILQLLMDCQEELLAEKGKLENKNESLEDETDQYGSVLSDAIKSHKIYKTLSEDELVAQCVLFFMVGYETTASTLSYMAYSLALNTDCQDKLIKEVDEAYQKHKKIDYDIARDMKYLDCVISETLRIYPPATRIERTACEDYKLGNTGITVEKGVHIGMNVQAMHLDEEFFPSPEVFNPERFLPENATHPQYAYLPFGAGPRNCVGMRFALLEIKLCICNIMLKYRFKRAPTTKVPLEFTPGSGLLSVKSLPLLVEKRY